MVGAGRGRWRREVRAAARAVRRVRGRRRACTLLDAVLRAEGLARLLHDARSGRRAGRRGRGGVRQARRLARRLARHLALPAGGAAPAAAALPARPFGIAAPPGAPRRRPAGRREGHAAAQLGAAACLALCRVALDAGHVYEAYARLRQAGRLLLVRRAARRPWTTSLTLLPEHAAAVAAATGRPERAVRLATAGAAQRAVRRMGLPVAGAAWLDGYLVPARRALPLSARARARAGGRTLPLLRAVAEALEVPVFALGERPGARRRLSPVGPVGPVGPVATPRRSWRTGPMAVLLLVPQAVEAWAVAIAERLAAVA